MHSLALFFILLVSGLLQAQKLSPAEIDTLQISKRDSYLKKGKFSEGIEFCKKTIQLSEEINYTKGKARGYIYIAGFLHSLGQYNEGMQYLQKAENLSDGYLDDPVLLSLLFAWYGKNYYALGFIKKSNENYDRAIKKAFKITNTEEKRKLLHFIYGNKAVNYDQASSSDSLYFYTHKAYKTSPRVVEATNLTYYFLRFKKNKDSAKFYLDEAERLLKTSTETFDQMRFYFISGRYYNSNKDYERALECYEKSLKLSLKMKRSKNIMDSYWEIAEIYRIQNDIPKSNEYLLKYIKVRDSLAQNSKMAIQTSEKKIIDDEKKQYQKSKGKLYYILGASFLLVIFISLFSYSYYRKSQHTDLLLEKNKSLISQKNEEVEDLKIKVNEAFDGMLLLAKTNDPSFITRFQELYPEFCNKLLFVNSTLNIAELTLCAMIWLGFSSKDIAAYTFITPKSVEMKKYRLRKRLDLEEQKNLYLFLKNL